MITVSIVSQISDIRLILINREETTLSMELNFHDIDVINERRSRRIQVYNTKSERVPTFT
jgi:hypothetical protein